MSKKFTEEQYKKIIEEWENGLSYTKATKAVIDYLEHEDLGCIADEALALANMATREWAHEQFVEEEEKFLFTKIQEIKGEILSLNMLDNDDDDDDKRIFLDTDDPTPMTIQQVENYGYNLDAFNKTLYEHHTLEEDDLPF